MLFAYRRRGSALKRCQCLFENTDEVQAEIEAMLVFPVWKEGDKETVCYRRMPTNEEIQGFCLFICRGGSNWIWLLQPSAAKTTNRFISGEKRVHRPMAVTLGHRKEDDKQNKQRGSVGCAVHHHHQCQAEFTSNHVLFIILNSVFVKDILASLVFSCKTVNCSSAVFSPFFSLNLDVLYTVMIWARAVLKLPGVQKKIHPPGTIGLDLLNKPVKFLHWICMFCVSRSASAWSATAASFEVWSASGSAVRHKPQSSTSRSSSPKSLTWHHSMRYGERNAPSAQKVCREQNTAASVTCLM